MGTSRVLADKAKSRRQAHRRQSGVSRNRHSSIELYWRFGRNIDGETNVAGSALDTHLLPSSACSRQRALLRPTGDQRYRPPTSRHPG
mgnify:CR=1 FL=1